MTTATVAHLPADTVTAIADLFLQGRRVSEVIAHGLSRAGGWRKPDVIDVLNARGWRLDSDGRIPRQHRHPASTSAPASAGRVASWPEKGTVTVPRSPGRPQAAGPESRLAAVKPDTAAAAKAAELLARHPEPAAATQTETVLADLEAEYRRAAADGTDALLARAADSTSPRVAAALRAARGVLDELRRLLDADTEAAKVRARIAELDAERRDLAARLQALQIGEEPQAPSGAKPQAAPEEPKPAAAGKAKKGADSTTPIKHGTWGGFMQHRVRGEQACAACDTAREQTMAARAAKRAAR